MRAFRSCAAAALAGVAALLLAASAHAVTATVTDLGGQPVGVSTLKLDNVPVTPADDGSYALPPGTHEVVITTTGGATFISEVAIPDGTGGGRLTLEPGFGGIGKISYAPGPAPGTPAGSGMSPRESVPVSGIAPREQGTSGWSLTGTAGYEEWDVPRVGYGVTGQSGVFGSERYIRLSPQYISGGGGGLSINKPDVVPGVHLRVGLSGFGGDASGTASVNPGSGEFTGVLYHRRDPFDSTGFSLGMSPADVRTKVDFDRFKIDLTLWDPDYADGRGFDGMWGGGSFGGGSFGSFGGGSFGVTGLRVGGGVNLFYQRLDTDIRSEFRSAPFGDQPLSTSRQDLTEDQFGIGGAMKLSVPIGGATTGFVKVGLAGIYRDADLDSVQDNSITGFVAEVDDSDSGFTWQASAALGLEMSLDPNLSIGVVGRYYYYDETAHIVNPRTGDPGYEPTHLEDDQLDGWQLQVGARYAF